MALAATIDLQDTQAGSATFVSASATPTSGALYVVFIVGRKADSDTGAYRVPTLTGTNGWNITWTQVAAAASRASFAGQEYDGIDVYYGVAANGTAGTFTTAYGSPAYSSYILHALEMTGGPDLVAPIGTTASAHDDTAAATTVTGTLTGTPATTSIVIACAASDHHSGTMTPSTGYANLGSMVLSAGGSTMSQPMFDEAPTSTTVGTTFSAADILALSAVEVEMPLAAGGLPVFEAMPMIRNAKGRSF